MPVHILVPLDLSRHAEVAAAEAVRLARSSHGRVTLLHIRSGTDTPPVTGGGGVGSAGHRSAHGVEGDYLANLWHGLTTFPGVDVAWEIRSGRPEETVTRFAAENHVNLIALTAFGQGGASRAWLGGMAEAVVRTSPVPVLVVRPRPAGSNHSELPAGHILVALDGNPSADTVVRTASSFASLTGSRLTLARVGEPYHPEDEGQMEFVTPWVGTATLSTTRQELSAYLRAKADLIREHHPDVRCEAIIAPWPVEALMDAAAEHRCDVIAIGVRDPHSGYLGGVADKLLRGFEGSVLVCRTVTDR